VRDGLTTLLGLIDGLEVVGVAVDGADAVEKVGALAPDVVLMDLHMPTVDGVEATRRITAAGSQTRVVVLTTYTDDDWVFAALRAGARGFLTKDASAEEIRDAITTVAAGDAQLDPGVQRRLLEALSPDPGDRMPPELDGDDALTARERDVLRLVAQGRSNAEIAAELFVSGATVKTHINHLLSKTAARDRAQLVLYAIRRGLG
jgi:DNA-binding NarL/FixJ family response regulator